MIRPRSLLMLAAVVVSLLACAGPGAGGEHTPALGPYALTRISVSPVVRADPVLTQDAHVRQDVLRETRHMCNLRGNRGSC